MTNSEHCPRLLTGDADAAHRELCLDCARLHAARHALRAAPAEPTGDQMAQVWRGVAERRDRSSSSVWGAMALAAAAAAVVVLAVRPLLEPRAEVVVGMLRAGAESWGAGARLADGAPFVSEGPATIAAPAGQIEVSPGASMTMDARASELAITAGRARIALAPEPPLWIATPHARVRAQGAVLRVSVVAARTVVEVESGAVEVGTADERRRVEAGQAVAIARAVASPVVGADSAGAPGASGAGPGASAADGAGPGTPADLAMGSAEGLNPEVEPAAERPAPTVSARSARARRAEASAPAGAAEPAGAGGESLNSNDHVEAAGELARARAMVATDPAAARALTETVRAMRPSPALEAEALMIESDAARRSGDLPGALALCGRVIHHAHGAPFAEEAYLRAARIHATLGDPALALERLEGARGRFPRGPLWPEREALAARLLREAGDLAGAAARVESVPLDGGSVALADERLALAFAVAARDPARARALAEPLTGARWPAEIRARAARVLADAP